MVYPDQDGDVMSSPDVIVVGGGWAGLTAATLGRQSVLVLG